MSIMVAITQVNSENTQCLIYHTSVNKGGRDIQFSSYTNQKLSTSGLFCKDVSHIFNVQYPLYNKLRVQWTIHKMICVS